jgi:hypothetical protein
MHEMRNSYKWTSKVALSTLAGVKDVEIQDQEIVGLWREELRLYTGPSGRTLVEQFVNWANDPQGTLRFVRRYGPLSKPQPGQVFRQSLQQWRKHQAFLQGQWRMTPLGYTIGMKDGEMLRIAPKKLSLTVESLERFLEFEIWLAPAARRRICARPHCETPWFIATNPKQQFCTEKCAEWAQRQHKQQWWAEHGDQWRKERKARRSRQKKK